MGNVYPENLSEIIGQCCTGNSGEYMQLSIDVLECI